MELIQDAQSSQQVKTALKLSKLRFGLLRESETEFFKTRFLYLTNQMPMRKPKLYLETLVWNFCFADDAPDRKLATLQLFEQIRQGAYDIFVSEIVFQKVAKVSLEKRELLSQLLAEHQPEQLDIDKEVLHLASQYLVQGVLPARAKTDSKHAAVATVYQLDAFRCLQMPSLVGI